MVPRMAAVGGAAPSAPYCPAPYEAHYSDTRRMPSAPVTRRTFDFRLFFSCLLFFISFSLLFDNFFFRLVFYGIRGKRSFVGRSSHCHTLNVPLTFTLDYNRQPTRTGVDRGAHDFLEHIKYQVSSYAFCYPSFPLFSS